MSAPKLPRDVLGARDRRYAVRLEYCGKPHQQWVARFCGDWIGSAPYGKYTDAVALCHEHQKERMARL